jgi:hypothetical protein
MYNFSGRGDNRLINEGEEAGLHILEPADKKELRGDLTPEVLEAWEEQGRQGRQGRQGKEARVRVRKERRQAHKQTEDA